VSLGQAHNFKTTYRDRTLSSLLRVNRERPPGTQPAPEKIVLEVPAGVVPSGKPPVRIYVGTEAAQFRAERVFVWSIMRQRDPSRIYEIHLMKDLEGFNRHRWKTGFTCYRYAIPTLAGGTGRAIYNDVDQIYVADPAELFDLEMNGKGMLGINEDETSVMLLDCEKMIRIWHLAEARKGEKHKPFRAAVHGAQLWGPLPGVWNARDGEYVEGQSKVLHFTTLQTQPWHPFPLDLRYRPHHLSELWHDLDREADRAGFTVFTRPRPSQQFHSTAIHQSSIAGGLPSRRSVDERLAALIRAHGTQTLFSYRPGSEQMTEQHDGIVCTDLALVPADDIPWILDEVFTHARHFVYAEVRCYATNETKENGSAPLTLEPEYWWREQFAAASRRHPGIDWLLVTATSRRRRTEHAGLRNAGNPPRE
jgi:hypothetical protein